MAPFSGGGVDEELKKFADALRQRTRWKDLTNTSPPQLTFTNLRGHTLSLRWKPAEPMVTNECLIDNKPIRYDQFPLLSAPGAHHPNGGNLTLQAPSRTRVYDFKKWTVTESPTPPAPER